MSFHLDYQNVRREIQKGNCQLPTLYKMNKYNNIFLTTINTTFFDKKMYLLINKQKFIGGSYMDYKWIQLRSKIGEMQKWGLLHVDTKRLVLIVQLSNHGSVKENYKIRKKIRNAYCRYYNLVMFNKFQFF